MAQIQLVVASVIRVSRSRRVARLSAASHRRSSVSPGVLDESVMLNLICKTPHLIPTSLHFVHLDLSPGCHGFVFTRGIFSSAYVRNAYLQNHNLFLSGFIDGTKIIFCVPARHTAAISPTHDKPSFVARVFCMQVSSNSITHRIHAHKHQDLLSLQTLTY